MIRIFARLMKINRRLKIERDAARQRAENVADRCAVLEETLKAQREWIDCRSQEDVVRAMHAIERKQRMR